MRTITLRSYTIQISERNGMLTRSFPILYISISPHVSLATVERIPGSYRSHNRRPSQASQYLTILCNT